ncbi:hypothetical protein G6L41_002610 [Agrobacterium tumefaciens]|uniref:hypothetical protein n=1 Tax=Agrobacterium tumefaciens TaxID=358 RepID=UPI001571B1ED|nr:hypothetical protein [Agrobacterium tumefaciens]WCK13785.1 hypothetical protein G6L41_002610 [Agrobacterium tumefaciens]
MFDFTHHNLHIESGVLTTRICASASADAALRRSFVVNMGGFCRSAKIAIWRLTVHYSLTMPLLLLRRSFDFNQGEERIGREI